MKLNAANRAFLVLVAVSVGAWTAVALATVFLVAVVAVSAFGAAAGPGLLATHDVRPILAFLAPIAAGAALGWRSLRRQYRATRTLSRHVGALRVAASTRVRSACNATGLPVRRLDVVEAPEPFSFAYGLVLPRVVVSTGLVAATTQPELEAVLEHERYHVRNLDPLKVLLARVLPSALFFLPVLRDLRRRYVTGRELAADRRAIEARGRPALAGALLKVVRGPEWSELGAAAAIGGTDLLDIRVSQLETGHEPEMPRVSRLLAAASTAVAATLVASFAWAVGEFGGAAGDVLGSALVPRIRATSAAGAAADVVRLVFWVWLAVLTYRGVAARLARRGASGP